MYPTQIHLQVIYHLLGLIYIHNHLHLPIQTKHEGMVLHRDGDLTKFVDRIEFSRNNAIKGK